MIFLFYIFRGDSYCSVTLIRHRRYPDIVYIAIFLTEKYLKQRFISFLYLYIIFKLLIHIF